ncbi:AraC family transcriptional regulator [Paenibacillus whitsoniae]|uniref:AraC family transcriptional regulator n=1 Tax=Paenibacillus whitsoniae TaxID=2496558 RepID=A0A3S0AE78_9BACL|nr:AraC family transcriptional regulator [Paenibacillus whitsoniae]RTE10891.1 AraC family transcriptional regulator [Paenibacillus whitsoniae]
MRRQIPIITESDRLLPYYLVDVGSGWKQEHIVREKGYFYQWIQCMEGEGELRTAGKTFRVKEGMAMLLLKNEPHEYYALSPSWIVDWIVFDGRQVEPFLRYMAEIQNSGAFYVIRPDIFISRIQQALDIQQSDRPMKGIQCSSVIYALLTDIIQYASVQPNQSADLLTHKLKPLLDYIEQNYNQPLALESMAELTGVTPQHLCTIFKKTINVRIFQYINSVRIKKSKELLLHNHPQMQIKEIATLTGFEDANYFSTVFKQLEKISPNEFRKIQLSSRK